ncbi:hypothetical protein [Escherichia coli]|nr:hypothetical protein [Escherichia coli]
MFYAYDRIRRTVVAGAA